MQGTVGGFLGEERKGGVSGVPGNPSFSMKSTSWMPASRQHGGTAGPDFTSVNMTLNVQDPCPLVGAQRSQEHKSQGRGLGRDRRAKQKQTHPCRAPKGQQGGAVAGPQPVDATALLGKGVELDLSAGPRAATSSCVTLGESLNLVETQFSHQ